MTAIVWKDKQNVNILMNTHSAPLDGNFCDEHKNAVKPAVVHDSRIMGYVDKEAIFHFLDLTIPISFIILASCGSKL